jgi:hypothetical protein
MVYKVMLSRFLFLHCTSVQTCGMPQLICQGSHRHQRMFPLTSCAALFRLAEMHQPFPTGAGAVCFR